jgi:hypothetical protein
VRTILREALAWGVLKPDGPGLGQRIHAHFASLGGVELELPARRSQPRPPEFGEGLE